MDAPLSQGRVILGKYRVERVIGKGAMGVVLAARHIQLDDRVAIKLLLPEMLAEPGVQERFLREAKAARRIKSEHVARVIDVGELDATTPYIIMEYLEGKDLAKIRGERGALEIEEVVDYVIQACDAIAEAHSHGIVHRDLKPANLFLARRPDGSPLIKVLDFGTSKMPPKEADPDLEMTQTGMAIGSPSYMAPEQMLSSRNLDARADIWALGVILYNLLTGSFPFRADTLLQMCAAVIQSPPIPPSRHRGDLPPALEAVILKCLQKKPDERFSDVAALVRGLLPFATAEARFVVERIERVLGVTSDLAPFLAPSVRGPQLQGNEAMTPGQGGGLSSSGRSTSGTKEVILTSIKSLSTTSLATVVGRGSESKPESVLAERPAKRRVRTALLGAATVVAVCAGLFFVLSRSERTDHPAAAAQPIAGDKMDLQAGDVRPLDTAITIHTPTVTPQDEPSAAPPSGQNGDLIAQAAAPIGADAAPDPVANSNADPEAAAGAGLATAQGRNPRRPRVGAQASRGAGPTPDVRTSASTPAPAPAKTQEIAPIIPDDR